MSLAEAVSIRLCELMSERKLTRYGLFKKSGVDQSTIRDIVRKRNKGTNLYILFELTQGLGIDLATFFDSPLFRGDNIVD